jgi:hypothetical protein
MHLPLDGFSSSTWLLGVKKPSLKLVFARLVSAPEPGSDAVWKAHIGDK